MRAQSLLSFPPPTLGLVSALPPKDVPPQAALDGLNCFMDLDGYLRPRPGYSPLVTAENVISGSVEIADAATTAVVTMPTPQATTAFPLILTLRKKTGTPLATLVRYTTPTLTQFTVEVASAPGAGNAYQVDWYIPETPQKYGSVTFAAGISSVAVVFGVAEVDASYRLNFGQRPGLGTPFGVIQAYTSKLATGFTLEISSAPGAGESIVVNYHLFRDLTDEKGTVALTGAGATGTVTFGAAQPDTTYQVEAGAGFRGGALPVAVYITNATTLGFDYEISGAPTPGTIDLDWHVARRAIAKVGEAVLGGISFEDETGTIQYVIATQTKWFTYDRTLVPAQWRDITDPAAPNSGSLDDQVRFIAFPYLGNIWVLGVNNTNPMRAWRPGLATYTTPTTPFDSARDIAAVGSRIFVVNTVEGAVRYGYRTRWSDVDNFTSWNGNAVNDLSDQGQPLQGVERLNRTSAAIYGQEGITLAVGQPGTNGTAFRFEEIVSPDSPGPLGPASIVSAVGSQYFMGLDARLYSFNGVVPTPVSKAVDPTLRSAVNLGFASRCHAVYNQIWRQLWFFFPQGSDVQPRGAGVFTIDDGRFEPLQNFPVDFITTSFPAVEQVSVSWDDAIGTWDSNPYGTWDSIPDSRQPTVLLGTADGEVMRYGTATTDDGEAIAYSYTSPPLRVSQFDTSLMNVLDLFFQQVQVMELVHVTVSSLPHPSAPPTERFAYDFDVSNPRRYLNPPNPQDDTLDFSAHLSTVGRIEDAYLQLMLSGLTTARQMAFGGAELFVSPEKRG